MADQTDSTASTSVETSERLEVACPECHMAVKPDTVCCPHCGREEPGSGWRDIDMLGDPWLGRVLGERYRLLRPLGRGASGAVYEAESLSIKRSFAVKVIDFSRSEVQDDATRAEERFDREVETLGELRNPHIVSVYELLRPSDDIVAIVMDLVTGRTLQEMVNEEGPIEPGTATDLMRQVANGLHEAHQSGIIHRDIKPANIIVEELPAGDYFAHILDFGVVYRAGDASDLTQGFVGTPLYASPEQARGEEIDRRADVYSLGATAFFMLTGAPPFEAETAFEALRAHLEQSAPRLSVVCDYAIPPEFDELMASLLAKDPDRRPDSLTTIIEHLNRIQRPGFSSAEPILAVDASPGDTQDSTAAAEQVLAEEASEAEFERSESKEAAVIKPHQISGSSAAEITSDSEVEEVQSGADETVEEESMLDSDSIVRVDSKKLAGTSIVDAALTDNRLAVLDVDGVVHIADKSGGFKQQITVSGARNPTAVAVDTHSVFVGDNCGQVHRCRVETGDVELLFEGPTSTPVSSLVTCAEGERLVVGFSDGTVIYYDMTESGRGHAHQLPSDVPVSTVALCREFGGFAVCREDRTVSLHSMERPDLPVAEFETSDVAHKAAFSRDAHLLAISEEGGTLEIYHSDTGHQLMPPTKLRRKPMTVMFDEHDRLSAMCEIDGTIYRWDLQERFLESDADSEHHTIET